jgi:hypothetical protein
MSEEQEEDAVERTPHQHTLGELLQDHATTEEKVARAAKSAPVLVIAVMLHVLIGGIMMTMYFVEQKKSEEQAAVQMNVNKDADAPVLEEKKEPEKEIERTAIPEVENTDVSDIVTEDFSTVVDDTVNPYATSSDKFGMAEGTDDAQDNLLTMSSGGKGLAGAIGVGGGSSAGGGMRKGNPLGGARNFRRSQQKGNLEQTEKVVMAGLDWLKRHQSPDGSWDPVSFGQMCDTNLGGQCGGRGSSVFTAGVTGLALLTYLGAGYDTQRQSPFSETVKKGLKWLKASQTPEGCFGSQNGGGGRWTYSHACATLAMCEAYASTKQSAWKKCAQEGVKFIGVCQNPYKAWRYGVKPGDNDSSVTGWMLMALHSAKEHGLEVDVGSMKSGLEFINSMTDEETGRTGYFKRGDLPVRPEGQLDKWPASESEALTAVAMCSRIFCDTATEDAKAMKAGAELLSKKLPVWDVAGGKIDMYYWYYGTLAMFQMGGGDWERWNKALKTVVIDQQIKEGCARGSWEPLDPWCEEGSRVYATCLMTLCLEVYYRYPRVFGTSRREDKK